MRGIDMALSLGQHGLAMEQLRRQHERVKIGNRQVRVVVKSVAHRDAALAGGGTRECARRLRQIEAGRLTASNGVVS